MSVSKLNFLTVALAVLLSGSVSRAYATTTTITADPNAATSNFQNPGLTATVGYTITTTDDGSNFTVTAATADPNALPFGNFYFDTIASTPNTGSNLGFEVGTGGNDAFYPNTGVKYDTDGTGVTSSVSVLSSGTVVTLEIPNNFFITNPLGIPFADTPDGTLVSLHLSQAFGYSVVGGSANFPAPVELGDATVSSVAATPEPSSMVLLGTGMVSLLGMAKRRMRR